MCCKIVLIIDSATFYSSDFFVALNRQFAFKRSLAALPHEYIFSVESLGRVESMLNERVLSCTSGLMKMQVQHTSTPERWEFKYIRMEKYQYIYRGDIILRSPVQSYHLLDIFSMQIHSSLTYTDFKQEDCALARVEILQVLSIADQVRVLLEYPSYRYLVLPLIAQHRVEIKIPANWRGRVSECGHTLAAVMQETAPAHVSDDLLTAVIQFQDCCEIQSAEICKLLFTVDYPDRSLQLPVFMMDSLLNPEYNLLKRRHKFVRLLQRAFWDRSASARDIARWVDLLCHLDSQATLIHDFLREVAFHTLTPRAIFARDILLHIAQYTTQPHILQYLFPMNLVVSGLASAFARNTIDNNADKYYRGVSTILSLGDVVIEILDQVHNISDINNLLRLLDVQYLERVRAFQSSRLFFLQKSSYVGVFSVSKWPIRSKRTVTALLQMSRDLRKQHMNYRSAIFLTRAAVTASRLELSNSYALHKRASIVWQADVLLSTYHRHCMLYELRRRGEHIDDPQEFVNHRVISIFLFKELIYFDMRQALLQMQADIESDTSLNWQHYMHIEPTDIPIKLLSITDPYEWQILSREHNTLSMSLLAFIENPPYIEFLIELADHLKGSHRDYLLGIAQLLDPWLVQK